MSDHTSRKRAISSETKTLLGLGIIIFALIAWLDYRDVTHDEISAARCEELNGSWLHSYRKKLKFTDDLDRNEFGCPSLTSGMVLGLNFLERTTFSTKGPESFIDPWKLFIDINPVLGHKPGMGFAGLATYAENRIDLSPKLLKKGDPVEIAGALVHEIRHLQQGINTHVPCLDAEYLGCDEQFMTDLKHAGAYSYSAMFYHQVLRFSDADAQSKRSAARLLKTILENRFNRIKPEILLRYEP